MMNTSPGPLNLLFDPDIQRPMASVVEAWEGVRRAFEALPRIMEEALRPVRPSIRRVYRQARLADHRRRQDARRVQAKVGRRKRSGR